MAECKTRRPSLHFFVAGITMHSTQCRLCIHVYTGWPKKVSHYTELSKNNVKSY